MDCIIERCESGKCGNTIKPPILYRLPSDFKLRLKWCQQIARFNNQAIFVNDTDGKIRYICSDHFEESDFEDQQQQQQQQQQPPILNSNCGFRKLKSEAIPTKFFGFTNNQQSCLSKNLPNGYGYEFHPTTTTNEVNYEHTYNATLDPTTVGVTHFNQHYNNNFIDDNIYEEIAGDMVDEFNEEVVTAVDGGIGVGIGSGDDECNPPGGCFDDESGDSVGGCDLDRVINNYRTGGDHEQLHLPFHLQNSNQTINNVSTIRDIDPTQQQFQISQLINLNKSAPQQQQQQQSLAPLPPPSEKHIPPQSQSIILAETAALTAPTTYVTTEIIKPDSSNINIKDDIIIHSIVGLPQSDFHEIKTIETDQLTNIESIESFKLNNVEQLCHKILDEQHRFSDVMSIIKYTCCDKTEFNPQIPTITPFSFNGYLLETNATPATPSFHTKINNNTVCRLCLIVKQKMVNIDYTEMSDLFEKVTKKKLKKISKDLSNLICLDCINLLKNTTKIIDLLNKVDDYWSKMQDESIEYNNRINKTDEHEDDDGLTVLTQPIKQNLPLEQDCDFLLDQPMLESSECFNGNDVLINEFHYLNDFDNKSVRDDIVDEIDLPICDSGSNVNNDYDDYDDIPDIDDVEPDNNYDHCYNYKIINTTNVNNNNNNEQINQPARINSTIRRNTICADLYERYRTEKIIIKEVKEPPAHQPPNKIPNSSQNPDGLFECDICNDTFSAQLILDSHQLRHQYSMDQLFECERCQQLFPSQKCQAKHFARVHNSDVNKKRQHFCLKCDEVFSSKHQLNRHDFLVHINSKQPKRRNTRCQSGIDFKIIDDDRCSGGIKRYTTTEVNVDWLKTKFNSTNVSKRKRKISTHQPFSVLTSQQQSRTQLQMRASFKCHLCIDSCHKSLISLKYHFLKSHTGDWNEIVQTHCLQCPAVFDNIVELEEHRFSDHNYQ